MKNTSNSLEETKEIAKSFLDSLEAEKKAKIIALQGDLGAGKTAFAQAVGEALGVRENMASPTFVIMKVYALESANWSHLIHIDAYRIEKEAELLHLGWEEIIKEPENLILIEWPENVPGIIPEDAERITFKFVNETTREISYA